jgi:CDGSH-type Zn-finger protein
MKKENKVKITKDGPYIVSGNLPMDKQIIGIGKEGEPEKWIKGKGYPNSETCALCRCGKSKNKPFCDGTHIKAGFDGTETASRESFEKQSEKIVGPGLILKDSSSLCAAARFCHRAGSTWNLTERSDDSTSREIAIEEACNCPSGRLVACDKKTKKPIEPNLEKSISLVEDPQNKVSGPIWVKGSVPVESSDGTLYEIRNRVTLCRCGKSRNKPFCDGSHIEEKFNDGDESLKK